MSKSRMLRLYVWKGFATDYTPGIAFALAYSVKEAREQLIESGALAHELEREPDVYDQPMAMWIYGGG